MPVTARLICTALHSWVRGRGVCGARWAPSMKAPGPGSHTTGPAKSLRVGVPTESSECSAWSEPEEKQEKYVCVFLAVVRMGWVVSPLWVDFSVKPRYGSP